MDKVWNHSTTAGGSPLNGRDALSMEAASPSCTPSAGAGPAGKALGKWQEAHRLLPKDEAFIDRDQACAYLTGIETHDTKPFMRRENTACHTDDDLWMAAVQGDVRAVREALENGANIHWEVEPFDENVLRYKGRATKAQCIHAAAVGGHSEVMQLLIEKNSDLHAKAKATVDGRTREHQPIHFAAASGSKEAVTLLLQSRVDPNTESRMNGEFHYYPIHDAAWFNQSCTMRALVEARARVDAVNKAGQTALHIGAQLGNVEVVEYLLSIEGNPKQSHKRAQRLLRIKAGGLTALDLAVHKGMFPSRKLHIFTRSLDHLSRAQAFLKVSKACPAAVPYLLRPRCDDHEVSVGSELLEPISAEWKECFRQCALDSKLTVHDLSVLVTEAPQAFMDLVEVLTDTPRVDDPGHWPLPIRAKLPTDAEACSLSTEYRPETHWAWDASDLMNGRPWHHTFAPPDPKRGREVRVKVVRLKGLADLELVYSLSVATDLRVFTKIGVHALLRYIWSKLQWIYFFDLLHESIAVGVISAFSASRRLLLESDRETYCVLWSLLTSHTLVEFMMLVWGVISILSTLHTRHGHGMSCEKESPNKSSCVSCRSWRKKIRKWACWAYGSVKFLSLWKHRILLVVLTFTLVCLMGDDYQPSPEVDILMSICAFLHWVLLLIRLRAFPWIGKRVLPVMRSMVSIFGMTVILVFLAAGFLHAYWGLHLNDGADGMIVYDVSLYLFAGEPFAALQNLDGEIESKRVYAVVLSIISLFVFSCCALNVFIAVLSDIYEQEQERIVCTFLQERAKMCMIMLVRPRIKLGHTTSEKTRQTKRGPQIAGCEAWSIFVVAVLLCAAINVGLVRAASSVKQLTFWPPAIVMSISVLLIQGFMRATLTENWEDLHLWFCHDANVEEVAFMSGAEKVNTQIEAGRLTRIRNEVERLRADLRIRLDRNCKEIKELKNLKDMLMKSSHFKKMAEEHGKLGSAASTTLGSQQSSRAPSKPRTPYGAEDKQTSRAPPPLEYTGSNYSSQVGVHELYQSDTHSTLPTEDRSGSLTVSTAIEDSMAILGSTSPKDRFGKRPVGTGERGGADMAQMAVALQQQVNQVHQSVERVHLRLDQQEANFKSLQDTCQKTLDRLLDVLDSADTGKAQLALRSAALCNHVNGELPLQVEIPALQLLEANRVDDAEAPHTFSRHSSATVQPVNPHDMCHNSSTRVLATSSQHMQPMPPPPLPPLHECTSSTGLLLPNRSPPPPQAPKSAESSPRQPPLPPPGQPPSDHDGNDDDPVTPAFAEEINFQGSETSRSWSK